MITPDVAIIGGGVIGCAIAYYLAREGAGRVLVIDRSHPGHEASGAAAGLLAVASSRAPGGVLFDLRRVSAALFPKLVEELRDETGIDTDYRADGLLDLAFTDQEASDLERRVARRVEQEFRAELLDPSTLRKVESDLSEDVRAAALFSDDCSVDSVRLVAALHEAARSRGVEFRVGAAVTSIETAGDRVTAIAAGGERVMPARVVLAAGAWSREIGALFGVKIPVRPDKGEMLAVQTALPLRHSVSWGDGYLLPRSNGELLIGATSERGTFDKQVTEQSVRVLRERAARMVPALRDVSIARSWAGLRPCSTIRRPIIGPLRGYQNVIVATGHHRSGILLAPITGKLVAELIVHRATSISIEPFAYRPR
jgi:glycine oxidase